MKMKPTNLLSEKRDIEPAAIALGFFDGVHLGHLELINRMISYSKSKGLKSVIFTFDKSPKKVLNKNFDGYITTSEEKFDLLYKTDVDEICYIPFTQGFANLSKEGFIKEILIDRLDAKAIFAGFNFTFGANKSGNSEFLKRELNRYQRVCELVEPVKSHDNITISSSSIRKYIKSGDIQKANSLLGRRFSFSGKVVHGDHRATGMGFPTANILLKGSEKCLPPNGVYACYADTSPEETYPAIVNIGYRPTFNKNTYLLEAHLCNFSGDLYEKEIRVSFLKAMRPEIKFPNMGALINQIDKDRKALLNIL